MTMPFPSKERLWYLRAWGNGVEERAKCQFRTYSEEKGFYRNCQQEGESLYVARWTLQEWGTVGIPFCRHHFMELSGLIPFTDEAVIYPELAEARGDYRQNKASFDDLEVFNLINHRTRIGDWGFDLFYFQMAQSVVCRYLATHPEDKLKPIKVNHRPTWLDFTEKEEEK
jgi:hypothetical protein